VVGKFGWFGRSGNLGGLEVWKDLKGRTIGRKLSPVINVFLQLRVDCVSYSGDYLSERLVHSTTVVLHVVHIHFNISTIHITLLFIM
jgi:hypothetical protein